MKEKSVVFITFLLFVLLLCSSAYRLLPQKQGEKELVAAKGIIIPALVTDTTEDISNLMGSEDCNEEDEECLKRRVIAEAHLDYIYTQHHKP